MIRELLTAPELRGTGPPAAAGLSRCQEVASKQQNPVIGLNWRRWPLAAESLSDSGLGLCRGRRAISGENLLGQCFARAPVRHLLGRTSLAPT